VEKIQAICNLQLWENYIRRRETVRRSVESQPNLEALKRINWVNKNDILPVIDSHVGEAMLITQMCPNVEHFIARDGFDPTRGTAIERKFVFGGTVETKGMLGEGSYFSDSFAKCMTYSLCPLCAEYICDCRGDDSLRVAVLARVILGIPKNRAGILKPEERTKIRGYNLASGQLESAGRHSIYAKGSSSTGINDLLTIGAGVNEFAVQNKDQIYPEFIIYWRPKPSLIKLQSSHILNKEVFLRLPNLRHWSTYWTNKEEDIIRLLELLNTNIINKPYEDDNFVQAAYRTSGLGAGSKRVNRFNHGIIHSLRQWFYIKTLCELICEHGNQKSKTIIAELNNEKKALMELSAILCRAGRTNEKGHTGDPTYSYRSGKIVSIVATRLNFSNNLVVYDNGQRIKSGSFPNMVALQKSAMQGLNDEQGIIKELIDLSHHIDLIRCHKGGDVFEYTHNHMREWFDLDKLDNITMNFIQYATALCINTGDRVAYKIFTPDNKAKPLDHTKFLTLSNDIEQCIEVMRSVKFGQRFTIEKDNANQILCDFPKDPTNKISTNRPVLFPQLEEYTNLCICGCRHKVAFSRLLDSLIYCEHCSTGYYSYACAPERKIALSRKSHERTTLHICHQCYEMHYTNLNKAQGQLLKKR